METIKEGDVVKFEHKPGDWGEGTVLTINGKRAEVDFDFAGILWKDLSTLVFVSRPTR